MSKKPPHKQKQKKPDSKSSFNFFDNPNNLTASLDLHHGPRTLEEVGYLVDRFLVNQRLMNLNLIKKNGSIKLGIIVGLGNNSQRKINGKNPLRHYVEMYLSQTDIVWRNGWQKFSDQDDLSLIVVELE